MSLSASERARVLAAARKIDDGSEIWSCLAIRAPKTSHYACPMVKKYSEFYEKDLKSDWKFDSNFGDEPGRSQRVMALLWFLELNGDI